MKRFIYIIGMTLLGCYSCVPTEQEVKIEQPVDNPITFSARKNAIITRAGDTYSSFDAGTLYDLYALDCASAPNYWTGTDAVFYANRGVEQNGSIIYTVADGQEPGFNNRTLDFYGVTLGTTAAPQQTTPAVIPPKYKIEVDANDKLPDLMRAYEANRTSSQGRITLDFKHTLSKLIFEVGQQVTSTETNVYDGVYIEKIKLTNLYESGTLDLVTGNYTKSGQIERVFYDRSGGTQIPIEKTPYRFDEGMLIFPREADDLGLITVDITLGRNADSNWRTVSCPLQYETEVSGVYKNYSFKPNYQYILTLELVNGLMKLVVFSPQVYEWMDVNAKEDEQQSFLGRPITFAGLMWMDRNLGAKSADPYNEYDKCAGFYYQFGRSIPYMFDESANLAYTYGLNGELVYGGVLLDNAREENTVAWMPGDIVAANYPGDTSGGYKLITSYNSNEIGHWVVGSNTDQGSSLKMQTFWHAKKNQPCPEGWRMPEPEDISLFMPDPVLPGEWFKAPYVNNGRYGDEDGIWLNEPTILNSIADNIFGTINGVYAVYMLKDKGTDNAYRIRIERVRSTKAGSFYYYEISRYAANASDDFSPYDQTTIADAFDWDYPTEVMTIPCSGYLMYNYNATAVRREYGETVMLRTPQMGVYPGGTIACYFRALVGANQGLGLQYTHGAVHASQIRCVRNLN